MPVKPIGGFADDPIASDALPTTSNTCLMRSALFSMQAAASQHVHFARARREHVTSRELRASNR